MHADPQALPALSAAAGDAAAGDVSASDLSASVRRFAQIAAVALIAVVIALVTGYRALAHADLLQQGAKSNAVLGQVLVNVVEGRAGGPLGASDWFTRPSSRSRDAAGLTEVDAAVRRALRGTTVVMVKFYDRQGLTRYSTEAAQIGEDRSQQPAVQRALRGERVSVLSHRDKVNALEGRVFERSVLATHEAVRDDDGGIVAVVEVHDDLTPLRRGIVSRQWLLAAFAATVAGAFHLLVLGIVRRGARRIEAQRQRVATIPLALTAEAKRAALRSP